MYVHILFYLYIFLKNINNVAKTKLWNARNLNESQNIRVLTLEKKKERFFIEKKRKICDHTLDSKQINDRTILPLHEN